MRTLWLTLFALLLLGGVVQSSAQPSQPQSCPALVSQAIASIGNTCSDLARNNACYGYDDVTASFTDTSAAASFKQPSDRAGLATLKTIATSPLDTALAKWGIALMSVQANLPDTLPGQNTVFMLLGDTQVENAVPPAPASSSATPVQVTTGMGASLFYLPDTSSDILRSIPPNIPLSADAIAPGGQWLRVVFDNTPGWVTRATLAPDPTIDSLPTVTPQTHTPMQAFYLRTGISGTNCTQAPDSLVVQGPQNLKVDINVNGADIRLGSTIALRIIPLTPEMTSQFAPFYTGSFPAPDLLELFVIDGHAVLNAGTPNEITVPTGYYTLTCLSDNQNLGDDQATNDRQVVPGCPWLPAMPWQPADFDRFSALNGVWLNYPIHLPDVIPPSLTPMPTQTSTHGVAPIIIYATPRPTVTPVPQPSLVPTYTATVIPFEELSPVPPTDIPTATPEQGG